MAPDKIYIQPNARDGWFEGEKPGDNFEEYIRKDALLDFLKGLEKDSARHAGTDDKACGAHDMVLALMEKIESL